MAFIADIYFDHNGGESIHNSREPIPPVALTLPASLENIRQRVLGLDLVEKLNKVMETPVSTVVDAASDRVTSLYDWMFTPATHRASSEALYDISLVQLAMLQKDSKSHNEKILEMIGELIVLADTPEEELSLSDALCLAHEKDSEKCLHLRTQLLQEIIAYAQNLQAHLPNAEKTLTSLIALKNNDGEAYKSLRNDLRAIRGNAEDIEDKAERMLKSGTLLEGVFEGFQLLGDLYSTFAEVTQSASKQISALFPAQAKEDPAVNVALRKISEKQELTDYDLKALYTAFRASAATQKALAEQRDTIRRQLQGFIVDQIKNHPTLARTTIHILALSIGSALLGPVGGFALKATVDTLFNEYLPTESAEGRAERLTNGIIETIGSFLVGGSEAALAGGAATAINQAPQTLQTLANTVAVGVTQSHLGVPLLANIPMTLSALGILGNTKMLGSIGRDMKRAWKVCKEKPLMILPNILRFMGNEVVKNFRAMKEAVGERRVIESICRIALVGLGVLGLYFSLPSLFLLPLVFYLVNKRFEIKYNGFADLNNEDFRRYILDQYNYGSKDLRKVISDEIIRVNDGELPPEGPKDELQLFIEELQRRAPQQGHLKAA